MRIKKILFAFFLLLMIQGVSFCAGKPFVSLDYRQDQRSDIRPIWGCWTLEAGAPTFLGMSILRHTALSRNSIESGQLELDLYPKLWSGAYAYINIGTSEAKSYFPMDRYGLEIYQSLGDGYEVSLGWRYLSFTNSEATVYTTYLGKYIGDWWLAYRYYHVPYKNGDIGSTHQATVRRYLEDADNYVTLRYSLGSTPDGLNSTYITDNLHAYTVGLDLQKRLHGELFMKCTVETLKQELIDLSFVQQDTWMLGIKNFF